MSTTFMRSKVGIVDSAKVIGCKVENARGENLGKIESIMLDLSEARILYAVLSFGGFLGMGDKLFPIPVEALSFRTNDRGDLQRCIVDLDKEALKNAPGYDREHLPESSDRSFATQIYTYYGHTPYWSE